MEKVYHGQYVMSKDDLKRIEKKIDDAFLDDDIMLKEVYKVFVRGTISLISKENILEKINDEEIED